jgi:hypothetical protein
MFEPTVPNSQLLMVTAVFKLIDGEDVPAIEAKIKLYQEEHADQIIANNARKVNFSCIDDPIQTFFSLGYDTYIRQ